MSKDELNRLMIEGCLMIEGRDEAEALAQRIESMYPGRVVERLREEVTSRAARLNLTGGSLLSVIEDASKLAGFAEAVERMGYDRSGR